MEVTENVTEENKLPDQNNIRFSEAVTINVINTDDPIQLSKNSAEDKENEVQNEELKKKNEPHENEAKDLTMEPERASNASDKSQFTTIQVNEEIPKETSGSEVVNGTEINTVRFRDHGNPETKDKKFTKKVFPSGFFHQRHQIKSYFVQGDFRKSIVVKEKAIEINIVIEDFRFSLYVALLALIFIGYLLTHFFASSYFGGENYSKLLTDVFGSLSLCVYFDFPPATYVLPSIYSIIVVFAYLYSFTSIFRAWVSKAEKRISPFSFKVYSGIFIYFALSASYFSTIFAVQPNPAEDPNTILIHTIPYTNLCLALSVIQVAVTWFGMKVAWVDLKAPHGFRVFSVVSAFGLVIATCAKLILHINALGDLGACDLGKDWKKVVRDSSDDKPLCGAGLFWRVHSKEYIIVSNIFENAWKVFAILIPVLQSGYFWFQRFRTHFIVFSIRDNKTIEQNRH